jgi:hypothetical protein
MRNVFVVSLCVLGLLFLIYRGGDQLDRWISNYAGLCFFGVALFPTRAPLSSRIFSTSASHAAAVSIVHLTLIVFALSLLLIQAWRFARLSGQYWKRRVYFSCQAVILGSGAFAVLWAISPAIQLALRSSPLFWAEGAALMAFGISWVVKSLPVVEETTRQEANAVVSANSEPTLGDAD